MINYIAMLVSLAIAGVSAYFSIIGLTALFAAAFWPIVCMGTILEIGKLTTASWLYHNWSIAPKLMKWYLTISVIVLMGITSLGIFGFLSKAHIEQSLTVSTTQTIERANALDNDIRFAQVQVDDVNTQIGQIDAAISKLVETGNPKSSLRAITEYKKTKDDLLKKKNESQTKVVELSNEKLKLDTEVKKIEAEVGPLKYIAALIYGEQSADHLESAVRLMIIILVLVFDPLAVVLLVAANTGIRNPLPKRVTNNTMIVDDSKYN